MFSNQMFSEWLDAVFPDWFPLISAILKGAFGVLAIGFLVCGLAPDVLFAWLPPVVVFGAASAGYAFRQKRPSSSRSRFLLAIFSGTGATAAAAGLQFYVDRAIFGTHPPAALLAVFLACGLFGAFAGQWLRRRYETIGQNHSATQEFPKL